MLSRLKNAATSLWSDPSEALAKRAEAPLYRDPFAGICEAARGLSPEERAEQLANCPRCGGEARDDAVAPEAGCLLEGLMLDLNATSGTGKGKDNTRSREKP